MEDLVKKGSLWSILLAFLTNLFVLPTEKSLAKMVISVPNVKIAVFSDPHYFSPKLLVKRGSAFEEYLSKDRKMIAEGPAILESALKAIKDTDVDIVLIPGDLTKDGEEWSHLEFASLLWELKRVGKKVYIINGNHDVNNASSFKYDGDKVERVNSVTPERFREIYREYGYGEAISTDPNSLSYVVEPVQGFRIIAMDPCRYNPKATTGGGFSKETLNWILSQVSIARREGKFIVGMMHHGLLEHFDSQKNLFKEYVIDDYETVASRLAEAGLRIVFTGHFHAQDIVKRTFSNGYSLIDIETGSLVTSPSPYRIVEITENKMYIRSYRVESINYNTGGKSFQEYARDYLRFGIDGAIYQTFTSVIANQGFAKDEAIKLAKDLLDSKLDSKTSIKDLVIDAIISHYAGDERLDPKLKSILESMRANINPLKRLIASTLLSLYTDPSPADNDVILDLSELYVYDYTDILIRTISVTPYGYQVYV
ncbi:MAG: metallophosphoesterase [bacterium]|nr:metallophosphoesterase [bacterium]